MKKILIILIVVLVLFGCVSTPKGISKKDFDGVWKQVDGSSVLTLSNGYYELVDMERGLAGYGTFTLEFRKNMGGNSIVFKDDYILYLNNQELPSLRYFDCWFRE